MDRERHPDSANLISALRGFYLPALAMSGRRIGLALDGRGRLKFACTLIGAGAAGVLLALKFGSTTSASLKKFPAAAGLSPRLTLAKKDATIQRNEDVTIPGLLNVGNNCFLNVVLQALASSKAVVTFLTTCAGATQRQSRNVTSHRNTAPVRMPLAVSVSSLMRELSELGEASRTSSPRQVMLALRSYARHFDLASQQDAAEALLYLASALQEERDNYVRWLKPTFQTLATISKMFEEGAFSPDVQGRCKDSSGGDQLLESWRGQLHWPLEGTLSSSLICQRCAHQYTTQIQFFNDIPLTPSQDLEGNIRPGCTLESCLEQFTRPEWIDDVKCSNCSHEAAAFSINSIFRDSRSLTSKGSESEGYSKALQAKLKVIEECGCDEACACANMTRQQGGIWRDVHANASKQLKIGRSPEVLCFQVQRMTISADGGLKKLTGHVAFPKVLDLFPFTIAAESCDQTKQNVTGEIEDKISRYSEHQETRLFDVGGPHIMLGNEGLSNGAANLVHKNSNGHAESLHFSPQYSPENCVADQHDSNDPGGTSDANIGKAVEDSDHVSESGAPLAQLGSPTQGSGPLDGLFDDITSTSPFWSTSNGRFLMTPSLTSSISLPHAPMAYSRSHLWSLATLQDRQVLPSADPRRLLQMPGGSSLSHTTNRSCIKKFKYSRTLLYGLVSVIVHQGGSQSGHYIVYRKVTKVNSGSEQESKHASDNSRPTSNPQVAVEGSRSDIHAVGIGPDLNTPKLEDGQLDGDSSTRALGNTVHCEKLDKSEGEEVHDHDHDEGSAARTNDMLLHESGEDGFGRSNVDSSGFSTGDNLVSLWFRVSDTHVQRVPVQEVFNAHASLLFYEQI